MVVCKFFQQGNCRYGQNCRFDHIYGSKYSYQPNAAPQAAPTTATDEQLIQQVQSDIQAALRGNQWLLSSYAPFKEKPAFPGLTDLSFEEARLFIYEAKASNNVEQAVAYMNDIFKEARAKYEQLLLKNSNITRVLRSIYNGENVASTFGNTAQENSGFGSPASSVFRSAVQTSPFTQTNQAASIFSQNNTQAPFTQNATPSIFAQNNTSPDPAKSIFAQANQNQNPFNSQPASVFSMQNQNNQQMGAQPNAFSQQADAAKSIFAQATQNTFTSPQAQSNPSSIFASAAQSTFNQSPFSQNQGNVFEQANQPQPSAFVTNVFQQPNTDVNMYSKIEDLSAEELEAFNSSDFKMGFVPELPPPQSLCF